MLDNNNLNLHMNVSRLKDLRKTYPRAGLKWDIQEDDKLKNEYQAFQDNSGVDFFVFAEKMSKLFGRTVLSIQGRLAKYFNNVPGWDYEKDKLRVELKEKENSALFSAEESKIILKEYEVYKEAKRETYVAFLKKLSGRIRNLPGKEISFKLSQLSNPVVKYSKEDIQFTSRSSVGKDTADLESENFNFAENLQAVRALKQMNETNNNIFLTGEAGTGKSTLLKYFRRTTQKNIVVLAPTGVAALNVLGQTIHSFCGFGPDITLNKVKKLPPFSPKFKLLQKLNAIIIDEISMVRADLLDCLDKFLRLNGPSQNQVFGGLQMIFIGDLYQLPPVEKDFNIGYGLSQVYQSPYFFDALSFKPARFETIQLKSIYRQKDPEFINLLNAVRNNAVSQEHLTALNTRSQNLAGKFAFEQYAVYLVPTNSRARQINNFFLDKISAPLQTHKGFAFGKFVDRELPTDLNLQFKLGAQIMMLNNDRSKRWVNGTMGKIVGIKNISLEETGYAGAEDEIIYPASPNVVVELETGDVVDVTPYTWEMYAYTLDKHTHKIDSKTTGSFTQYPFKLAWAVTIHKAQGKTFDKVYIDLATGTFAHGQLYVALSRCRTLKGLYLQRPITLGDILLDRRVVTFLNSQSQTEFYEYGEFNDL